MKYEFDIPRMKEFLKNTKQIYSKAGAQQYPDWIGVSDGMIYVRNGYVFCAYADAQLLPGEYSFMLNAVQLDTFLKKMKTGTITVEPKGEQVVKITQGKRQLLFNAPQSFDEWFADFYVEDQENYKPVGKVKKAIDEASKTIFKDNLQYSNCYFNESFCYSTDGIRISKVESDTPIETSIPYGTDKILFSEPFGMYEDNNMVSFRLLGDDCIYSISVKTNIGSVSGILRYLPPIAPQYYCTPEESFNDILETGKNLDIEFKRQDSMVEVKIEDNVVELLLDGEKTKYKESTTCSMEEPYVFKVHPGYFLEALKISNTFQYEPGLGFLLFSDGEITQMISVDEV